jgi:hypothetical protein
MTPVLALVAVLSVTATTPSVTPSPAVTPNPYTIYRRAVAAMRAANAARPPFAVYQLDYVGHNLVLTPDTTKGKTEWNIDLHHANDAHSYHVWYRTSDDRALQQDDATHAVYRGEPLIAPSEDNPLDDASPSPSPGASSSPRPMASTGTDTSSVNPTTQVLGAVTSEASRYYEITLAGLEQRDNATVYHLHLRAISDVDDHPLTDLYVDPTTFLVRSAHAEFTMRRVVFELGLQADVDYAPVGAYWLLANVHFHGNGYALFYHANMECTLRLHDITLPPTLPAEYFALPASPRP